MSNSDGGGERREKATPRRLRDARKQGQVSSSRDLSRTATSLTWLIFLLVLPPFFHSRLVELSESALLLTRDTDGQGLLVIARTAGGILLTVTALPIALVAVVGILTTRLQTGPVFSLDRIKPKLANISPASGIKRVFSAANLFETAKGLAKTTLIFGLVVFILNAYAEDIQNLVTQNALVTGQFDHWLHIVLLAGSSAALTVVSIGDWIFQKFDFLRNLRMNTEEIRRERQMNDGDPQLRSQRRRLQRQWATGNARQSARSATALVVNPTHIAVALFYEPETTPVPLVTASGEGNLAAMMRIEAETAGVPVLRSVALARSLHFLCEDDEEVPERLFDAVAEVLAWAISVRGTNESGSERPVFRESDPAFDRLVDG